MLLYLDIFILFRNDKVQQDPPAASSNIQVPRNICKGDVFKLQILMSQFALGKLSGLEYCFWRGALGQLPQSDTSFIGPVYVVSFWKVRGRRPSYPS